MLLRLTALCDVVSLSPMLVLFAVFIDCDFLCLVGMLVLMDYFP